MDLGLKDKVAAITGGSVGIGQENAPIQRFATPEEIANLFVFLCSLKTSYCVGSTLCIDGGWLKTI